MHLCNNLLQQNFGASFCASEYTRDPIQRIEKSFNFQPETYVQKDLSSKIHQFNLTTLQSIFESNKYQLARIKQLQHAHSSAWLYAQPSITLKQNMSPIEFSTAVAVRLGLDVCPEIECYHCKTIHDKKGIHATICKHGPHGPIIRHNNIRDLLHKFAFDGNLSSQVEQRHLIGRNKTEFC